MHPFDIATALTPLPDAPGRFGGRTSPDYANMVGPFGGVIAAVMLQAAWLHPERIGEPVALTVNFAAPIADGDFTVTARPARTNRSTQHWTMELAQGDEPAITATAFFAQRRETWSAPESAPPVGVLPAEALPRTVIPMPLAWTRRYDMRFATGGLPDALDGIDPGDSQTRVWLADDPPRPLDFIALASICDSFFPRVLMRRRKWAPIGTVSLTTYFHADAAMLAAQGARPILGCARGVNFRNGYFDQSAELWGDAGDLLATSHQVVYFRD